jgi:UPF0271 protein
MSAARSIDLNADVGEGFYSDAELVPLVTSVNIACGAHAGDTDTMRATVLLALRHGAAVGAHPGFADRTHFGRRELAVTPAAAAELVSSQLGVLQAIAARLGAGVAHVKLHGALYNLAARDRAIADAVAGAVLRTRASCGLVALAGSQLILAGRGAGLRVIGEGFADRVYLADGSLAPRSLPGSVISDEHAAARQALRIAGEGSVISSDGTLVPISAQTICIHGDTPGAPSRARRIRAELEEAGIAIRC